MAVLKWVILCDRTLVEADTRVLSVIGLLERINVNGPPPPPRSGKGKSAPLIPHRFSIVQLWERSSPGKGETIRVRVTLSAPDGTSFGRSEQVIDLKSHKRVRSIATVPGVPALGPGQYSVTVHASKNGKVWRRVGQESFELVFAVESGRVASRKTR
jgi:hypothetical protein